MKLPRMRGSPSFARRTARRGVVLFAVLAMFATLSLLAATIYGFAVADLRMAANLKRETVAVMRADEGAQYIKTRIDSQLRAGSLTLDGAATKSVSYTAPAGIVFDPVTALTQIGQTRRFVYRVTGRSTPAQATVEVTFRQKSAFEMGLFGNRMVDTKNDGHVYIYDSRLEPNPDPEDSIGGATVGSNERVWTHQDTYIDGSLALGETTAGANGTWTETPSGGSILTGDSPTGTDRIDPDPLGAVGGDLAATFTTVSTNNNNASASPPITGNRITLTNKKPILTLTAGNYYLTSITLNNGESIVVDASAGPVNIYLTGKMEAKVGSSINISGNPTDLSIFSNSTESLILKNSGDLRGLIYAPYAAVQVNNSGDFYGVAWGKTIEIKNSGDAYIDAALLEKYPVKACTILSWKDIRDA